MRFSADFNLLKQDDLKWFIRAGFVVGQIERRKEKLAGGIVLSIPSLSEGPIPDRVAVNASMRACVVFADVSGFETGALWAVNQVGEDRLGIAADMQRVGDAEGCPS